MTHITIVSIYLQISMGGDRRAYANNVSSYSTVDKKEWNNMDPSSNLACDICKYYPMQNFKSIS